LITLEDYHAMFLASPDGYLVVDGDGLIREANPKAEILFGWSREELIGSPVDLLVPEASRGYHGAHRDSFMSQPRDRPMGVGLDLRGAAGTARPSRWRSA
jgi:PAS domain S-box-containing protein